MNLVLQFAGTMMLEVDLFDDGRGIEIDGYRLIVDDEEIEYAGIALDWIENLMVSGDGSIDSIPGLRDAYHETLDALRSCAAEERERARLTA